MSPSAAGARLERARALLEQPTAPLLEAAPLAHLRGACESIPGVTLAADAAGNLAATYCAEIDLLVTLAAEPGLLDAP